MYVVYLLELYKWANDTELVTELWPIAKRATQWHLDVSKAAGVPERQCNTYDILGPENHQQVSYNSAFHLLAMRAAEELARSPLINDLAFADECATAFTRGQQVLDANHFMDRGRGQGHYSFALEDNTSLMVDTFYPQVLSYTLGLGPLVDEARLQAHLDTELEWNDSPYGLIVKTTGQGTEAGGDVWQMGSPNWASLNIHLGAYSVDGALEQPAKSLRNWRDGLKDLWNVAGIADKGTGLPSITSHYGYYMSAWHLPLAISGQQADLPGGSLSFSPKVASPYALPLFLPGVVGLIRSAHDLNFELELFSGSLVLSSLEVKGCKYSGVAKASAGHSLTWDCTKEDVAIIA
jgi:non-lysosomal glucosylceramidase